MLKQFAKWLISEEGQSKISITFLILIVFLMILGFITPPK